MAHDAPSPALPRSSTGSKFPIGDGERCPTVDDRGRTIGTIEAARVKVHHRPFSFEDGPVVYPANAFDSRLRGDSMPLVQVRQNLKKDFSGWRPAIAFLYLFLFHSLLRLTSFLSQNKNPIFSLRLGCT